MAQSSSMLDLGLGNDGDWGVGLWVLERSRLGYWDIGIMGFSAHSIPGRFPSEALLS